MKFILAFIENTEINKLIVILSEIAIICCVLTVRMIIYLKKILFTLTLSNTSRGLLLLLFGESNYEKLVIKVTRR